MKQVSVFIPDEEALSNQPRDITIRAMHGFAIVWFLPYRRCSGVIEIPDSAKEQSVEAVIIHDNTGYELPPGTGVVVSRLDGEYFEVAGERLCRVKRESLLLLDLERAA